MGPTARSPSPTRARTVGDDTINAAITVDGARQTATAAKKWETGTTPTPSLGLDPPTDTNPVGTQHTVTATVASSGSPLSGVVVSWSVTGANAGATGTCLPASCATGADGKVAFTYTGATAGDDTINASITVSGTLVTATAAKKWESGPPPSECDVEGKGMIQTGKAFGKVDFRVDVTETGGSLFLQTTAHRNRFHLTSVERCSQDGDTVSFNGSGTWNGAAATYEVTFVDKGFPGRNDTINIVIRSGGSTVFDVGTKLLENGNITVSEV